LEETPYVAYLYGYPHKTAYRPFAPALPLESVWARERREALFLYVHVPFCEMRCGFCNLFTAAGPRQDVVEGYLAALGRETRRVKEALGPTTFARAAIGGGTPTLLDEAGLHAVFDLAEGVMGADLRNIPVSVEVSPETVTPGKLQALHSRGVDRVSIGVQSFIEAEVAAVKRPQKTEQVEAALERIRGFSFPTLNIDLIYGMEGQTVDSLLFSLRAALRFAPEELYLYPLYVRPLTFLGKKGRAWDDLRLSLYRTGRDFLLSQGYTQVSMRMPPRSRGPCTAVRRMAWWALGAGHARTPEGCTTRPSTPWAPARCAPSSPRTASGPRRPSVRWATASSWMPGSSAGGTCSCPCWRTAWTWRLTRSASGRALGRTSRSWRS
jgi:oxygen-independent coproporphyrinogen III oxidase